MDDLATRIGVSRWSVHRVERGDPSVAIGTAFELATQLGIQLFDAEPSRLVEQRATVEHRLTLLPKTAKTSEDKVDDDF
ncbi:helix-turn-helix transcriptional regulator [Halomonas sp. TRM85114]|nr:helix-turn-helix transcriptional regulator [Halomonas jincaotanensis]